MIPITIRISGGLYASIVAITCFVMEYLFLPGAMIERAGQEAWLSVWLGGLYALLVSLIVTWIASQFPGRDPLHAIGCKVGKWAVLPVELLYTLLQMALFTLALRDLQDFTSILLLPDTPRWLLAGVITGVALYAVLSGLEPIARIAFTSLLPWILVLLLLPLVLAREFSILQIDPFLWEGPRGVLQGALSAAPWMGETIMVLTLLRHLSPKANPYPWTLIGVGGGTAMLALVTALLTLVFGSVLPARQVYPGYELLAIVWIAEGIERLQAAVILLWIGAAMVKISLNLYAAAEMGRSVLGIKSPWLTASLLAAAGLFGSQLWPTLLQLIGWTDQPVWVVGHVATQWAILLLLGSVALLTKVREGSHHG